jgi:hypothetical protein
MAKMMQMGKRADMGRRELGGICLVLKIIEELMCLDHFEKKKLPR